jgi:peptidoglycan-associated lipoprotein
MKIRFDLKRSAALLILLGVPACTTASNDSATRSSTGGLPLGDPAGRTTGAPLGGGGPTSARPFDEASDRVFFSLDRADLSAEARLAIERWAVYLRQNPNAAFTIEGHSDERGTREYNLALAQRRAAAAGNYLVSLGVAATRMRLLSYGKERPSVVGSTEAAWAQNRRAVIVVD